MTQDYLNPVPQPDRSKNGRDYHQVEIDLSDPRSEEPLVDIASEGIATVPYYHISDGTNAPYYRQIEGSPAELSCRKGLIPMLKAANAALADFECELVVYDACRPVSVQCNLFAWALEKIAKDFPGKPPEEIEAIATQYSSDPRQFDVQDPTTWPTHSTGGSVDVVLRCLRTGSLLNMGADFDDLGSIANTRVFEEELLLGRVCSDLVPLNNRRLLYWSMIKAGFTNCPAEYWHFDYGNQMYVLNIEQVSDNAQIAWYGYCEPNVCPQN